jgi:hypothetical protein
MRFPRYSVGLFSLAVLVNFAVLYLDAHYCAGTFGSYSCTGWVSAFDGFILLWMMLFFMVIPVVGIVALIRLGQWLVRRIGMPQT